MCEKDSRQADDDPQAMGENACRSDAALEQFAQQSVCGAPPTSEDDVRTAHGLAAHLETCPECRKRAERFKDHFIRLGRVLREAQQAPAAPCPGPEILAVYLDGGDEAQERSALEGHLAECSRCRERLCALYRETRAVMDPAVVVEIVERVPSGERVPFDTAKGSAPGSGASAAESQSPPATPEAGSADEGRKRRLSSQ